MKIDALGVDADLIRKHTDDPAIARAMAEGALRQAQSADLAIAITGVAGPEPDQGKPVGLVYIATLRRGEEAAVVECTFSGSPNEIIAITIQTALELGLEAVGAKSSRLKLRHRQLRTIRGEPIYSSGVLLAAWS